MKSKIFPVCLFLTVTLYGCLVKSLHPFYKNEDILFNPNLTGQWMDSDSLLWIFRQYSYPKGFLSGDTLTNKYEITYINENDDTSRLIGTLFQFKDHQYIDFFPVTEKFSGGDLVDMHLIPVHSLARIYIWGTENMSFYWYDEDWLNDLIRRNRLRIDHEVIKTGEHPSEKAYILTASTNELQKLIRKHGNDNDILQNIDPEIMPVDSGKRSIFRFINVFLEKETSHQHNYDVNNILINVMKIGE